MLKIVDNVDLKELENYGFKILYDENTGRPKELVKKYFGWFHETRTIIKFKRKIKLGLGNNKKIWFETIEGTNEYDLEHWHDILYDLIKDGLVVKE